METATAQAKLETLTPEPTSIPAPPEEIQELVPEGGRVVRDEKTGWWVAVDTKGRGKAIYTSEQGVLKMKTGSLVKVDDKWFRYMKGELVEWDIWESGFKVDFVGTVKEGDIELRIPFSLGLMPDIMERDDLPITGIVQNPGRPDGPDKLAWFFVRMSWYNYKREHPSESVSWYKYLEMVNTGGGNYKIATADTSSGTWNEIIPKYNPEGVIEKSPLDGFAIYDVNSFFNIRMNEPADSGGEIVYVDDKGSLVILSSFSHPQFYEERAKDAGDIAIGYGYNFSMMGLPILDVLVNKTHQDAMKNFGYALYTGTGENLPRTNDFSPSTFLYRDMNTGGKYKYSPYFFIITE